MIRLLRRTAIARPLPVRVKHWLSPADFMAARHPLLAAGPEPRRDTRDLELPSVPDDCPAADARPLIPSSAAGTSWRARRRCWRNGYGVND
jgi:hypothetical protein